MRRLLWLSGGDGLLRPALRLEEAAAGLHLPRQPSWACRGLPYQVINARMPLIWVLLGHAALVQGRPLPHEGPCRLPCSFAWEVERGRAPPQITECRGHAHLQNSTAGRRSAISLSNQQPTTTLP